MDTDEIIQDGKGNELQEYGNGGLALSSDKTMQQVRTDYTTAVSVQKPRALAVVEKDFLIEARLMGEEAYYGWGAGKDRIEGPSQALAYAIARIWGNCAINQLPLEESPDAWVFGSVFIDLETGFTLTRKFRQSKRWTVYGKLDEERKSDIRFQIGQTKGDRNVILKAIPKWLVNKGMEEAKAGVRKKLEKYINKHGLSAAIDYAVKQLKKAGVGDEQICSKFSVAKVDGLDVDQLVIMSGDIKAIQTGQEMPDALYPSEEADDIADQLKNPKQEADPQPADTTPKPPPTDPSVESEAAEVGRWIEELQSIDKPGDLENAKKNRPEGWSDASWKKYLDKIEMRMAEVRGKKKPKDLFDAKASATELGK